MALVVGGEKQSGAGLVGEAPAVPLRHRHGARVASQRCPILRPDAGTYPYGNLGAHPITACCGRSRRAHKQSTGSQDGTSPPPNWLQTGRKLVANWSKSPRNPPMRGWEATLRPRERTLHIYIIARRPKNPTFFFNYFRPDAPNARIQRKSPAGVPLPAYTG